MKKNNNILLIGAAIAAAIYFISKNKNKSDEVVSKTTNESDIQNTADAVVGRGGAIQNTTNAVVGRGGATQTAPKTGRTVSKIFNKISIPRFAATAKISGIPNPIN